MTTKIISNEYTRKYMSDLLDKTLVAKYWNALDEDLIWVECLEDPKLSGWIYYATLENWRIHGNT